MQPSIRTAILFALGMAATIAIATAVGLGVGGETGARQISDLGEALMVAMCAGITLLLAMRFRGREPHFASWLLIGLGMGAFAVGDTLWTYMDLVEGRVLPLPSVADAFYIAAYFLLFAALLRVCLVHGRCMEATPVAWFSAASGTVMLGVVWLALIEPYVLTDSALSPVGRILNSFYPTADVLLLFMPALFVAIAHARRDTDESAWPWLAVVAGTIVLGASDAGFSYLVATGGYVAGAIVDYGWIVAHVLLAVGASLAYDGVFPEDGGIRLVGDPEVFEAI